MKDRQILIFGLDKWLIVKPFTKSGNPGGGTVWVFWGFLVFVFFGGGY